MATSWFHKLAASIFDETPLVKTVIPAVVEEKPAAVLVESLDRECTAILEAAARIGGCIPRPLLQKKLWRIKAGPFNRAIELLKLRGSVQESEGKIYTASTLPPKLTPTRKVKVPSNIIPAPPPMFRDQVLATLKRQKNKPITLRELADKLDRSPGAIEVALESLQEAGYNVKLSGAEIALSSEFAPTREIAHVLHPLSDMYSFERKIGACGDNHLGSNHERLDVLNALYDLYENEGITDVYNTGNWIEGEMRLNHHDIKVFGLDGQIQYLVDNYPQRKGITTHFVAGDDHEGWYQRNERMEIGRYAEMAMHRAGREDFHYLGYVEADVLLKAAHGERIMKVMHPGGGSAYATSYAPQKLIESFQGGERPEILLLGHYHKFDHGHYRNTHYVQTGCTVDQSIFMRKQKISAAVGGTILTFNQAPDGAINRFKCEWIPFYDRGYYEKKREFGIFEAPKSMVR